MISRIVRLLLIALLVAVGVHLWYGRVGERLLARLPVAKQAAPVTAVVPDRPAAVPVAPARVDTAVILKRNIFKATIEAGQGPAGKEEVDLDALEETRLQLVLLGTVSGSREDARAIIRDEAAKKEDIYQVGSDVQGALLSRIERGRVVLQVNGREEILTIKDPESGRAGQGVTPGGGLRPPDQPGAEEAQPAEVAPPEVDDRKVPEALPRRRINFRNTVPPGLQPAEPPGEAEPANPVDLPPPPMPEEAAAPDEGGAPGQ